MISIPLFTNFRPTRDHNASFSIDGVGRFDTVEFVWWSNNSITRNSSEIFVDKVEKSFENLTESF